MVCVCGKENSPFNKFEKEALQFIEKSIMKANLGLEPTEDALSKPLRLISVFLLLLFA